MVVLRAPSTLPSSTPSPNVPPPKLSFLTGQWNVTHSTLPMWKKNRNVRITYTPIPGTPHIDDMVTYQPIGKQNLKTVHGVDKPFEVPNTAAPEDENNDQLSKMAYQWRGKGWLMIASSKWEILGHGLEDGTENGWVVTYFAKTMFTPAGVDFYSRQGTLKPETVQGIKAALKELGGDVAKLGEDLFEVAMDDENKA